MPKEYANTLRGFRQWCKDHPFNVNSEHAEFHTKHGFFLELTEQEFSDGTKAVFASVKKYDPLNRTFTHAGDSREISNEYFSEEVEAFAKKHNLLILQ